MPTQITMSGADRNPGLQALDYFYYLSPLWFIIEVFFWPNFRAGVVFGPGLAGIAAFYSVEAGIGAALWFRLPYADAGALVENVAYLICVLKFILYSPLDAAMSAETGGLDNFSRNYASALPGMIYSMTHLVLKIKSQIAGMHKGWPLTGK